MPLHPGDILLDKYRIESLLGQGAFAEVYRVTHLGLDVPRALKLLRRDAPGLGSTEFNDFTARFRLEAQIGAKLNTPTPHPNLLQVHNFEATGDQLVLEMEYAPGGSLAERIQKSKESGKALPIEESLQIALDVAEGLAAIHARDIIHRDLKPSNILFDNKGNAKVADLGLAQVPGGPSMRSKLSTPQSHPGTPGYMSPEQEHEQGYLRPTSDIYSLGIVLFEMLTGRNYTNLEPGTLASDIRSDIPKWLDDLLASMLAEDPKRRPWDGKKTAALIRSGMRDVEENTRRVLFEKKELEREVAEKLEREKARLALNEKARREKTERQAVQRDALKKLLPKLVPFLRSIGLFGIIVVLFWAGSWAIPKLIPLIPTPKAASTQRPATQTPITNSPIVPAKTTKPTSAPFKTPTKTRTPVPTSLPTEITDAKGVPMVLVPAGEFVKGLDNEQKAIINQECLRILSLHSERCDQLMSEIAERESIFLQSFYIDKYETTNAQYQDCAQAGICQIPERDYLGPYSSYNAYYSASSYANYPFVVTNQSFAKTYCEWRGARLPTNNEWEKAARGTDGRLYPWGNTFDCHKGNFNDTGWAGQPTVTGGLNCDGYNGFAPVTAFSNGVSPYGIFNMAGNVAEYVVTNDSTGFNVRGGYMRMADYSNFSYLSVLIESYGFSGVRCVLTP